jgi:hypothetical protein
MTPARGLADRFHQHWLAENPSRPPCTAFPDTTTWVPDDSEEGAQGLARLGRAFLAEAGAVDLGQLTPPMPSRWTARRRRPPRSWRSSTWRERAPGHRHAVRGVGGLPGRGRPDGADRPGRGVPERRRGNKNAGRLVNALVKGSQRSLRHVPPGGVGMSPWWWVAIGFAALLAVAPVVGLVAGQVISRRLQALLPPDPATGENPREPARAAPARVVFRILQASERKRQERPAGRGPGWAVTWPRRFG